MMGVSALKKAHRPCECKAWTNRKCVFSLCKLLHQRNSVKWGGLYLMVSLIGCLSVLFNKKKKKIE